MSCVSSSNTPSLFDLSAMPSTQLLYGGLLAEAAWAATIRARQRQEKVKAKSSPMVSWWGQVQANPEGCCTNCPLPALPLLMGSPQQHDITSPILSHLSHRSSPKTLLAPG